MKYIIFFLSLTTLHSADLYLQNVKPIVKEILNQHVEFKEITPLIMKRAFRLYIYRFDPQQTYLTTEEIKPFLTRSEEEWSQVTQRFINEDYSDFRLLQETICNATLRAQDWRKSIRKCLIETPMNQLISYSKEKHKSTKEVFDRNESDCVLWFVDYCTTHKLEDPTKEEKEKALQFYEKIKLRKEEVYVSTSDKDFSCQILKSVVASLDAHSAFYTQEEAHDIRASLKRQFCGIGVVIAENADGYYVAEISPYGPAAASGLISVSDQILAIDGKNLQTLSLRTVMKLLQGEEGSILSLKVQTKQNEIKNVHLVRKKIVMEEGRIKSEAIPFGKGVIGYFQIDSFYDNREGVTVEKDLREAINELSKEFPLVGIILDMRNNLGGFLDQAIKVCGVFIEKGVVVIAKYAGGEIQYSRDYDPYNLFFGPIVVLTSKTSASAAEIVAQTLQDYGAAVVVGDERTYGKGSMQMQTITDESAKYFYKVTVGKYYTISGRSTQIEGVKPHIHVATQYAPYHIGEKFLQFPLQADSLNYQEAPKGKLKQFFTIYQQKKNSIWTKMVPLLAKNSEKRLLHNSDYQDFIALIKQCPERYSPLLRHKDLAKKEAIAIIQDMALIQK